MSSIETPRLNKAVAEILNLSKAMPSSKKGAMITLDGEIREELAKNKEEPRTFERALLKSLNEQGEVERLAFESDPASRNQYGSVYKTKGRLIPDRILKRIAIQDDLVAAIVQARCNHIAAFGRMRPNRFSTGFIIEPTQEALEAIEKLPEEQKQAQKAQLQKRISQLSKKMVTCGRPNLDLSGNQDRLTFPQYLSMSMRNAIVVGRIATEVLYKPGSGKKEVMGFRVMDAGTIYRAEPQQGALEGIRKEAKALLSRLKNKNIDIERFSNDEFTWVQVLPEADKPVQVFTSDECLVHNFYAVPDVELDGYPVTPLDTVLSAVTTHINITTHNKLYFQSGRAARGMLVIQSDEVDEAVITRVRQQFNAQINSVNNAWRMPVFGIGQEDKISWQPIDSGGRDMEFQYLMDMNARVILSAFMMSPEELPGWSYLSRGTNSQALSEGNNEYKMQAARDVGIRPLLAQFEDFINQYLLPLFDPDLSKVCVLKLVGLDAETAEKESVRLQQDMPVHMTYDEVLEKVEKRAVGKAMGGEFPLNPQYQAILDKYLLVGKIKANFFGDKEAEKDPQWQYCRDPFWFQWQQLLMQQQQMQQQAQAQQQQQAQGGGGDSGGGDDGGGGDGGGGAAPPGEQSPSGEAAKPTQETTQTENQKSQSAEESSAAGQPTDLTRSIDQALELLTKSERQLPKSKKKLLNQHKILLDDFLRGWDADLAEANKEIGALVNKLAPKKG